jgi:hypothetical protein
MKNIVTMTAAVACAFALTACGGGDDSDSALSRADEGIWSNLNPAAVASPGMQAVILSDGSYWGVYGTQNDGGTPGVFIPGWVLHGTTSIDGSSVVSTYINTSLSSYHNLYGSGTYSGTVSAQNILSIGFYGYLNDLLLPPGKVLNMNYDAIYNQPALPSAIAGDYSGYGTNTYAPGSEDASVYNNIQNLTISGSNLTISTRDGDVIMTGTMTPHGTTVNVFDVSLATVVPGIPGGGSGIVTGPVIAAYKGILFQTSSGSLKNSIQIVATTGDSFAYYFMGNK